MDPFISIILFPIYFAIPVLVLYFVVKTAIKKAVIELKEENIL